MLNNKKNKRGELTTQQIVLLIILILSFIILLYFLIKLNLGQESEAEVCHNSIVLRSNKLIPTESVPLKCETQYVCITKDGTCEQFLKPEKVKVKTSDEVYQALALELSDCWWMFGEGELNYIGKEAFPEMYCSFCAQVAFDDSVKGISGFESGEFDKENFYKYIAETKMNEKEITYSEYLYGTNNYNSFLNLENISSVSFGKINLDKQYKVLIGVTSDVSKLGYAVGGAIGGGIIATGIILAPFTGSASLWASFAIVGGASAATGTGAYFLAPVVQSTWGGEMIPPSLIESPSEELNSIGCKNIETLS
ncbi:MAG: hypothetical protein WC812_03635 [Candidatus Pacearchaeota archaeon]|jgi:hypothetical protein